MEEECSESSNTSLDSEIKDLNKTSWENTGRKSSLCRWSSVTETIQFAESDSSRNTGSDGSRSGEGEEHSGSSSFTSSTTGKDEIRTESYGDESHERYSQEEFEVFEESDETDDGAGDMKEEFLDKKLQILTSRKLCASVNVGTSRLTLKREVIPMEYYENKIHLLKEKQTPGQEMKLKPSKKSKSEPCQLENARNVERLKVNNILFNINKKNAVPVHQPQKCKQCRKRQEKLTEASFVKNKTEILKKQQFEKNLEKHLYEKDSATLIAEIINCGPKPSDPPQEIWDRLLRKGQYS